MSNIYLIKTPYQYSYYVETFIIFTFAFLYVYNKSHFNIGIIYKVIKIY